MSEPRYPGVADVESTRSANGYSDGRDPYGADPRSADSYRSRASDPYGTPAEAAAGARRPSHGYPPGGEQPAYGGRSRAEPSRAEPSRGYSGDPGRGGYGAPAPAPAPSHAPTQVGGYPPQAPYQGGTTYDTRGGRSRSGAPTPQPSPASRVASAMRRSVSAAARGPRRARLQLKHIDPWSTLKLSLVLAVALFVVWMVAIGLLYGVLEGMGVFDKINGLYQDVTGKNTAQIIGPGLVLGTAALIGAINIVLFTALATVGSFIYNMCADLVGGVEVTLSEHD
ncbi:MAG TPA: DUF3566 domain-containing protein [Mycobacteriales bacterium]|nr:DUF3566 domain-containing protein [Mycobacteriales bacterium]